MIMKRIRLIKYRGEEICYLDFTEITLGEAAEALEEAAGIIRSRPHNSVLALINLKDAQFNPEVIKLLADLARGNEPYIRRSATVGLSRTMKIIRTGFEALVGRSFPVFDSLDEAMENLVEG
jgi:hypothetical protein